MSVGSAARPRVGFLGTGWIGRNRMAAICAGGLVEPAAIADPDAACVTEAQALAPEAAVVSSLDAMLDLGLDGVVIATPSALHADQAIAALERGVAVFCQKPLGRSEAETRAVIAAARAADRLLGVDFSYRRTIAVEALRREVARGALGRVYAADLVFHNAYGPGKPWFFDRAQAGGGCVMDLGVHLVDLLLWLTGVPQVEAVQSRLFAAGEPLGSAPTVIEDYALATLDLAGGITARLACSWNLHAGAEARIEATLYGTAAAASVRNVGGSFYDFAAFRFDGTSRTPLAEPPDNDWGGRVAADWAAQLASGGGFDPAVESAGDVAAVLDRIYAGS